MARNVIATLICSTHTQHAIILSAHVDHLGHGEWLGSRASATEYNQVHPGADDNASGVAVLLEAAQRLNNLKNHQQFPCQRNLIFAFWSGEELGVLGSSYFVNQTASLIKIDAVINLDMVGRLKDKLIIQGVGSSSDWPKLLKQASLNIPMKLLMQNDPYLPTDSTPFYLHNIPILNFFSGAHDDYHTPRDTSDKLNYRGMQDLVDFLLKFIIILEQHPQKFAYNSVDSKHHTLRKKLKVYLGTIPDYTSPDLIGVRLSGVIKNSPAARAGLKANDVILDVNQQKITDIYDYTRALNLLQPDNKISITILRRNMKLALYVIAKSPNRIG